MSKFLLITVFVINQFVAMETKKNEKEKVKLGKTIFPNFYESINCGVFENKGC